MYKKIVEVAVAIMGSQYATMQTLVPDTGKGKLHVLTSYNFDDQAEKFREWVCPHTGSSCGASLLARQRWVVSPAEFMRAQTHEALSQIEERLRKGFVIYRG